MNIANSLKTALSPAKLIAYLICGAALASLAYVWTLDKTAITDERQQLLARIDAQIEDELASYEGILRGLAQFVRSSEAISETEFQAIATSLAGDASGISGGPILAIGYEDFRNSNIPNIRLNLQPNGRQSGRGAFPLEYSEFSTAVNSVDGVSVIPHGASISTERRPEKNVVTAVLPIDSVGETLSDQSVTYDVGGNNTTQNGFVYLTLDLGAIEETSNTFFPTGETQIAIDFPDMSSLTNSNTIVAEKTPLVRLATYLSGVKTTVVKPTSSPLLEFLERHAVYLVGLVSFTLLGLTLLHLIERGRRDTAEAQREIEVSNYQKSRFLATMSHEFRTPLNGILGMSELISRDPLTAEQSNYLATMNRSAEDLLMMVNDLLDLSKAEAGKLQVNPVETNVAILVSECASIANIAAQAKGIELALDIPLSVPRLISIDDKCLRQIVTNLLSNAVKFTQKGHVQLTIGWNEGTNGEPCFLQISCADTGIGIESERIEQIFKPFVQADISTTREFGGTGLGLSIVRELVNIMNADIHATSEIGKGTTFGVRIPIENSLKSKPNKDLATAINMNILALGVQENPFAHECRALDAFGCSVTYQQTSTDSIDEAAGHEFDLAIFDGSAELPDKRVLHNLKVPKLLLKSSKHVAQSKVTEEEKTFDAVLVRPITPEELASNMSAILRSRIRSVEVSQDAPPAPPVPVVDPDVDAPPKQKMSRGGEKRRAVLCAEDNPTNQIYISALLESFGFDCTIANDGVEAIELIESAGPFEFVLMDCQMPVMDGLEATKELRRMMVDDPEKRTPIVALTANVSAEDRQRCHAAGMDDFLEKPLRAKIFEDFLSRLPEDSQDQQQTASGQISEPEPRRNGRERSQTAGSAGLMNDTVEASESPTANPVSNGQVPTVRATNETPPKQDSATRNLEINSLASKDSDTFDWSIYHETKQSLGDRFDKLTALFLQDGDKIVSGISEAISNERRGECVRLSHTLKSTSRMIGAVKLSETCSELEQSARDSEVPFTNLQRTADAVSEEFQSSKMLLAS